jgi:hypothetical protein
MKRHAGFLAAQAIVGKDGGLRAAARRGGMMGLAVKQMRGADGAGSRVFTNQKSVWCQYFLCGRWFPVFFRILWLIQVACALAGLLLGARPA